MFAASKSGSPAEATDAQFNYVTMLLHGDGTNGSQNNTFVDSSTNNFTITRNGNTTQGTFTPYGSNWSNYFNGSSSLSISSANTVLPTGTQDFSVELFVNWQTQSGSYPQIISNPTTNGFQIYYDVSAGALAVGIFNVANVITYTIAQSTLTGAWTHIAVTRSGNTFRLFVNGVLQSNGTNTISFASPTTQYIASDGSRPYTGYISNVRTVLGSIPTAYQTSSTTNGTSVFTPSTTPLTAVSGTALLTCADNRFIDDSTNAFAITVNGSPSVQRFSPFSPTTAYSTSVIGGSGYFDGTGDRLTVPANAAFNFSTGDFTVELWFYANTVSGNQWIVGPDNTVNYPWVMQTVGTAIRFISNNAANDFRPTSFTLTTGTWNHFAVTRSGSTMYWFTNGTLNGTQTYSNSIGSNTIDLQIGTTGSGSGDPTNGYVTDLRVVKGTAVYTSSFTPPTAPLSAITNTSLLLNYTNAGILDNAMMNDLETVGNAQISTSVKKYGTGSLYFDGTGDYLLLQGGQNFTFGTGDFTIEMWIYVVSGLNADIVYYDGRPTSTNGLYNIIYTNSTGKLVYSTNSADRITGTTTLSTGTWYHIALSRSGTSTKLFLNGTQEASTYTDSNSYIVGANRPVIGGNGYTLGNAPLNGYIDDLRITKGVARYTANFTAPTAAFADKG